MKITDDHYTELTTYDKSKRIIKIIANAKQIISFYTQFTSTLKLINSSFL